MLHVPGRHTLRKHIGDLLELQRAFQGHGKARATAEVEEGLRRRVLARDPADLLRAVEHRAHEPGDEPDLRHKGAAFGE